MRKNKFEELSDIFLEKVMRLKIYAVLLCLLFSISIPVRAETFVKEKPSKTIFVTPPAPVFSDAQRQAELQSRRDNVFAAMDDNSLMILMSGEPRIYTNDIDYPFRQENNLYYLTALKQEGITLILIKDGEKKREILFMRKRSPISEIWNGKLYSDDDARRISGIETIIYNGERDEFYKSVLKKDSFKSKDGVKIPISAENLYLVLPYSDKDNNGIREFGREFEMTKQFAVAGINEKTKLYEYTPTAGYKILNAQPIFAKLRLVKSPYEIKLIQHAIDITTEGLMRVMANAGNFNWEYEAQAEVEYIFRKRNADSWGFPSIVGGDENTLTLHYIESQGKIERGKLLLMDVGAEYDHYTADITRTFPVNGKFSDKQREIYQIVYDAQEAAAKEIKPGNRFAKPAEAARIEVDKGLAKLGLTTAPGAFIPGTEREVDDGKGGKRKVGTSQSYLWFIHGWGHWLGMNVHDVGGGGMTVFEPGMIMTNEPGIYIRPDALDNLPDTPEMRAFIEKIRPAFEKYTGIGVRIEDDMLVTENGVEWMTKNLPRKIDEIESFMKTASK